MADISSLVSESSSQSAPVPIKPSSLSNLQRFRMSKSDESGKMVWTNRYTQAPTSVKVSSTRNDMLNTFLFIIVAIHTHADKEASVWSLVVDR